MKKLFVGIISILALTSCVDGTSDFDVALSKESALQEAVVAAFAGCASRAMKDPQLGMVLALTQGQVCSESTQDIVNSALTDADCKSQKCVFARAYVRVDSFARPSTTRTPEELSSLKKDIEIEFEVFKTEKKAVDGQ